MKFVDLSKKFAVLFEMSEEEVQVQLEARLGKLKNVKIREWKIKKTDGGIILRSLSLCYLVTTSLVTRIDPKIGKRKQEKTIEFEKYEKTAVPKVLKTGEGQRVAPHKSLGRRERDRSELYT